MKQEWEGQPHRDAVMEEGALSQGIAAGLLNLEVGVEPDSCTTSRREELRSPLVCSPCGLYESAALHLR